MRAIVLVLVFTLFIVPVCLAGETPLEKAYSLHYQGRTQEAITLMEDYVKDHPDPRGYYFLGYAHYEMRNLDKSREYFKEAYRRQSFYSPMEKK